MGKTINKELAREVSARIQELLNETGLKLEGLAVLSGIGKSAIKSYYATTIPISVENIAKICSPFSLELFGFLNFKTPLPAGLKEQTAFKEFYDKHIKSHPDYFTRKSNKPMQYNDNDKGRLKYIVNETDYFSTEKLTEEMVEDFIEIFGVKYESGRLSQMLKSHLGVLDKLPAVKFNKDGSLSKKEVFKYVKKKK
ncbi:helix-turn-helix transcriptional regulator [Pedobacter nyackensis]|uniref:helix-turn-helix domain-containing protein n=1 Tax=Pedobacter nyackensis TaxID=475255 RepID=UPI00292E1367|nr:helix-turn-helix transcriptional regulator [Pedobacter nyackensis]